MPSAKAFGPGKRLPQPSTPTHPTRTNKPIIHNLEELYYDQLRDLHSAETQLISALPVMY